MHIELKKLVDKKYGPRPSSITAVPDDPTMLQIIQRVDGYQNGLSWTLGSNLEFETRLKKLGIKLIEGTECWPWKGGTAKNGVRPNFRGKQAYLFTDAAELNQPCETSPDTDIDHRCGNPLCVRPGLGHAAPNLRSIHMHATKQGMRSRKKPQ